MTRVALFGEAAVQAGRDAIQEEFDELGLGDATLIVSVVLDAAVDALDRDALVEKVAYRIHWTGPWEVKGYQPPASYEGAKEIARAILRELGLIEGEDT